MLFILAHCSHCRIASWQTDWQLTDCCRHIPVDVYGKGSCSDPGLKCDRSQDDQCLQMLNTSYKVSQMDFTPTKCLGWLILRLKHIKGSEVCHWIKNNLFISINVILRIITTRLTYFSIFSSTSLWKTPCVRIMWQRSSGKFSSTTWYLWFSMVPTCPALLPRIHILILKILTIA